MLAQIRARREREEAEIAEKSAKREPVKICTIQPFEEVKTFSTHEYPNAPKHVDVKTNGIGEVITLGRKSPKNLESENLSSEKIAESGLDDNMTLGETFPTKFEDDKIDFDNCTISDVIKFLQKLAKDPNASKLNIAFTKHITNALIEAQEERLKFEAFIPRKLQDGWEPTIRIRVNDFDCNALCDLGASSSIMPKSLYDMLELKPLDDSILGVHLIDSTIKRP